MRAALGSNLAAAELTGLVAATFFAVYWLRGGRAWLLPAGIGHLFVAVLYIYLLFHPIGVSPPWDPTWVTLTLPLCLTAANGFLFFGMLQLLDRAPPRRVWAAGWIAVGLAVIAAHVIYGPILAFLVAVASTVVVGPAVSVLLMAEQKLFYVIVGALLLARAVFQVVVSYFGAFHVLPAVVDLLVFINLGAVVGDGFGLILIEYDDTRRQLAEADRSKTAFLAGISHELRTPLNSIIGFAELIGGGPVSAVAEQYRGYATDIVASGRQLLGITNQVLEMAQIEMKRTTFDPQRLDLAVVVQDAIQSLKSSADMKGVRTIAELPAETVATIADLAALRRVVSSLIDNAIKFTPAGGKIHIALTATSERMARLVIADEGIGMSADEVRRLFTPYWQSTDVYVRRHGGVGLGLAISQKLVEAMGGKVLVDSALGRGSTFTVLLPTVLSTRTSV